MPSKFASSALSISNFSEVTVAPRKTIGVPFVMTPLKVVSASNFAVNALSVNEIAKITVVLAQLDVNRDGVLDAQELDVRGGGQGGKKKKISKK